MGMTGMNEHSLILDHIETMTSGDLLGSLAEIASAYGDQRRDLTLVETADHLRSLAGPTDLVARIGEKRFGIVSFDTDVESLEETWSSILQNIAARAQYGSARRDCLTDADEIVLVTAGAMQYDERFAGAGICRGHETVDESEIFGHALGPRSSSGA